MQLGFSQKSRHGYGLFIPKHSRTFEEFKAYSQNMGHGSLDVTDRLYGKLAGDDEKDVISSLRGEVESIDDGELFNLFMALKNGWEANIKLLGWTKIWQFSFYVKLRVFTFLKNIWFSIIYSGS